MSACKSCGASILWATSATSGKVLPLNLPPDPEGNLVVRPDGKVVAYTEPVPGLVPGVEGRRYVSHFATCPHANRWRKPGPPRGS